MPTRIFNNMDEMLQRPYTFGYSVCLYVELTNHKSLCKHKTLVYPVCTNIQITYQGNNCSEPNSRKKV